MALVDPQHYPNTIPNEELQHIADWLSWLSIEYHNLLLTPISWPYKVSVHQTLWRCSTKKTWWNATSRTFHTDILLEKHPDKASIKNCYFQNESEFVIFCQCAENLKLPPAVFFHRLCRIVVVQNVPWQASGSFPVLGKAIPATTTQETCNCWNTSSEVHAKQRDT